MRSARMDVVVNVLPTTLRRYSPKWARGTLAAVLVMVFTSVGVFTASSASAAGTIQIADSYAPNNNNPKQACSIVVEFFGFASGNHSATIKFSGQGGAGAGTPVPSTPVSGTGNPFGFAGSAGGGNAFNDLITYALDPIGAGLAKSGNGYLVDVDVVTSTGEASQKVIKVTGCDSAMTIDKSDVVGPDPVVAGGNVTYTLTATNASKIALTSFVITDTVTAPLTFVSATSTSPGVTCVGTSCTFAGSLAPNDFVVVTVVANVPAATLAASVTNSASVGPGGGGAAYDTDSEDTAVTAAANTGTLTGRIYLCDANGTTTTPIVNATWEAAPSAGGAAVATNRPNGSTSTLTAGSYSVTATVPSTHTLGSCAGSPTGAQTKTFAAGGSATATFYAKLSATAVKPGITASSCTNFVPSLPSFTIPSTAGVTYSVDGVVAPAGDVITGVSTTKTLTATANPGYVLTNPGFSEVMTFGALATCTTNAAAVKPSVTASSCVGTQPSTPSFTIPTTTGVTYSVDGVAKAAGDVITGVSTTKTLTATANAGYVLTNAPFSEVMTFGALATGCNPPPPPPPPAPPVLTADLGITKVGPTSAVKPGENIAYTLTVTNSGNGPATGVQVTDTLPAALSFVSASGAGFTCAGTLSISCQLATPLAAGASAVVNVVAKLAADYPATAVANTAVVLPTDSNPGNNTDSETTAVTLPTPPVDEDLGVTKSGLKGSVTPGGVLSWTVVVTNVKGTPAAGFTVADTLPAGLTLLTVGGVDWSCSSSGQDVTCTYTGAPLPVGSSSSFQLDGLVAADYAGRTVVNTAVVDPGGVDSTNDSSTATTAVTAVISGGADGEAEQPVEEPIQGETEEPAQGPALPFTGIYTDRALTAGVALLMLGLFLALAGRRRRSA